MAQLKVFNPKNVLANLELDAKNNTNNTFIVDVKEPPAGKKYQCVFLKQLIKTDEKPCPAILRIGDAVTYLKYLDNPDPEAAPKASYVEVTKGPVDPNAKREDEDDDDDKPKKKPAGKPGKKGDDEEKARKPNLATTVSKAGDFGKVVDAFDKFWLQRVDQLRKEDKITELKSNPLVQRKISAKNQNVDKEGKPLKNRPIDDPIIRMTLDFERYADDYFLKFLAGKPKTEIFDAATLYLDAGNKPAFKPAQVTTKDPETGKVIKTEPVTAENVHKLIRRGARIIDGRFHMDHGTESGFGVSSFKLAGRLVLDMRFMLGENAGGETPEDFDEETLKLIAARMQKSQSTSAVAAATSAAAAPVAQATATPAAAPAVTPGAPAAPAAPASDPAVDALIAGLVGTSTQ